MKTSEYALKSHGENGRDIINCHYTCYLYPLILYLKSLKYVRIYSLLTTSQPL